LGLKVKKDIIKEKNIGKPIEFNSKHFVVTKFVVKFTNLSIL